MGVANRDLTNVMPGPNGSYREWVRYRVWEEFKYFLSGNYFNLKEAAAFLFEGTEIGTEKGLIKLQNWLYLHSDIRNPTLEDFYHLDLMQRKRGHEIQTKLDVYYIQTGYRDSAGMEVLKKKYDIAKGELEKMRKKISEQEVLLREYQNIVHSKVNQ